MPIDPNLERELITRLHKMCKDLDLGRVVFACTIGTDFILTTNGLEDNEIREMLNDMLNSLDEVEPRDVPGELL